MKIISLLLCFFVLFSAIVISVEYTPCTDNSVCLERDFPVAKDSIQKYLTLTKTGLGGTSVITYKHIYGGEDNGGVTMQAIDSKLRAEALYSEALGFIEIAKIKRNYESLAQIEVKQGVATPGADEDPGLSLVSSIIHLGDLDEYYWDGTQWVATEGARTGGIIYNKFQDYSGKGLLPDLKSSHLLLEQYIIYAKTNSVPFNFDLRCEVGITPGNYLDYSPTAKIEMNSAEFRSSNALTFSSVLTAGITECENKGKVVSVPIVPGYVLDTEEIPIAVPTKNEIKNCEESKIAILGDSLSTNAGWGGRFINVCGENTKNYAVGGQNTIWMLKKLQGKAEIPADIKNAEPGVYGGYPTGKILGENFEYLIVLGGTNDIGQMIQITKNNLDNIYRLAKEDGMKVIAVTIPPFNYNGDYITKWVTTTGPIENEKIKEINKWIKEQKAAGKVDQVIDFYNLLVDPAGEPCMKAALANGCRDLHPNGRGYDLMAAEMKNVFTPSPPKVILDATVSTPKAAGEVRIIDSLVSYDDACYKQIKSGQPKPIGLPEEYIGVVPTKLSNGKTYNINCVTSNVKTPEQRAILDTLSWGELGRSCSYAYNIMIGYNTFTNFSNHTAYTGEAIGNAYDSGRYQFIKSTFNGLMKKGYFSTGFYPWEQDPAALKLIESAGVNQKMLESKDYTKIINKLHPVWYAFKVENRQKEFPYVYESCLKYHQENAYEYIPPNVGTLNKKAEGWFEYIQFWK